MTPNNMWCGVEVMKLLIMQPPPVPLPYPSYTQNLPQHPILEHRQPMLVQEFTTP
jgi:hypothetical protein